MKSELRTGSETYSTTAAAPNRIRNRPRYRRQANGTVVCIPPNAEKPGEPPSMSLSGYRLAAIQEQSVTAAFSVVLDCLHFFGFPAGELEVVRNDAGALFELLFEHWANFRV